MLPNHLPPRKTPPRERPRWFALTVMEKSELGPQLRGCGVAQRRSSSQFRGTVSCRFRDHKSLFTVGSGSLGLQVKSADPGLGWDWPRQGVWAAAATAALGGGRSRVPGSPPARSPVFRHLLLGRPRTWLSLCACGKVRRARRKFQKAAKRLVEWNQSIWKWTSLSQGRTGMNQRERMDVVLEPEVSYGMPRGERSFHFRTFRGCLRTMFLEKCVVWDLLGHPRR